METSSANIQTLRICIFKFQTQWGAVTITALIKKISTHCLVNAYFKEVKKKSQGMLKSIIEVMVINYSGLP